MRAPAVDLNGHVVPAFPPWLDLPPGYIVNDWIAWQKGKLVAARLRVHCTALLLWMLTPAQKSSAYILVKADNKPWFTMETTRLSIWQGELTDKLQASIPSRSPK